MPAAKHILSIVAGTVALIAATQAFAMTRNDALAVFKEATTAFTKVCTAGEHDTPPPLPATMEERTGNALTAAEGVLTTRDDAELLDALIAYINASDCSADESRAFTLGAIFHQRADRLEAAIAALADKERCVLVGQLDWGWQNDIYGKKIDAKLKADREARLKKLKAATPGDCGGGEN